MIRLSSLSAPGVEWGGVTENLRIEIPDPKNKSQNGLPE